MPKASYSGRNAALQTSCRFFVTFNCCAVFAFLYLVSTKERYLFFVGRELEEDYCLSGSYGKGKEARTVKIAARSQSSQKGEQLDERICVVQGFVLGSFYSLTLIVVGASREKKHLQEKMDMEISEIQKDV